VRAQARAASELARAHARGPLTGCFAADAPRVLAHLATVPNFTAQHAPAPLADEARARALEGSDIAIARIATLWSARRTEPRDYLARAMLRPYLETLRALGLTPDREHTHGHCPFCGGAPSVGCRRSGAESDGAARSLVCASCGLEWPFRRILCPACFEEDPHKLPSFTSADHPLARIEACETCSRYVKTLDVPELSAIVPEIDDLASLSLDLWAIEQGFERLEPGLAGV
jgi:formate dehydrogenase accessory protein FdhE